MDVLEAKMNVVEEETGSFNTDDHRSAPSRNNDDLGGIDLINDDKVTTLTHSSGNRVDVQPTPAVQTGSSKQPTNVGIVNTMRRRVSMPAIQTALADTTKRRRGSYATQSIGGVSAVERVANEKRLRVVDDNYVALIAKRGRLYAARQTRRLVLKNGEFNVTSVGITDRRRMYLADFFTTLVEMRWRYHAVIFAAQFVVTWLLFGAIYYVIAVGRGDIENAHNETWTPCVYNIYDFSSAVMFSIETQMTVGYGVRVMEPLCQVGFFVVMLHSCLGTFVQVLAAGIVLAKISMPRGRAKTLMFSRNAVICLRDDRYQLMFRVGDIRNKSHIIGTSIRALMVRNHITADGEVIPMSQYPLSLDNETSPVDDNYLFMAWPVTVVHRIDESSPLWDISAEQLIVEQFEIIVILEGLVESVGSLRQFRTSYLPFEIEWGQSLAALLTHRNGDGFHVIDYSQFHSTVPISMPDYSAKRWTASEFQSSAADETRRTTSKSQSEFATLTLVVGPLESNFVDVLLRRRTNGTKIQRKTQRQIDKSGISKRVTSGVWTVADPRKSVAGLTGSHLY